MAYSWTELHFEFEAVTRERRKGILERAKSNLSRWIIRFSVRSNWLDLQFQDKIIIIIQAALLGGSQTAHPAARQISGTSFFDPGP